MTRPIIRNRAPAPDPQTLTAYKELALGIQIDRDRLDEMVERQSQLYHETGQYLAEATSQRDKFRQELDQKDAELGAEYRRKQLAAGDKCTDKMAEEAVTLHGEHQRLAGELVRAKGDVTRWELLREDFSQRSFMLSKLCDLYASSYFSSNAATGNANNVRDALALQNRQRMDEKRKNKA